MTVGLLRMRWWNLWVAFISLVTSSAKAGKYNGRYMMNTTYWVSSH